MIVMIMAPTSVRILALLGDLIQNIPNELVTDPEDLSDLGILEALLVEEPNDRTFGLQLGQERFPIVGLLDLRTFNRASVRASDFGDLGGVLIGLSHDVVFL